MIQLQEVWKTYQDKALPFAYDVRYAAVHEGEDQVVRDECAGRGEGCDFAADACIFCDFSSDKVSGSEDGEV